MVMVHRLLFNFKRVRAYVSALELKAARDFLKIAAMYNRYSTSNVAFENVHKSWQWKKKFFKNIERYFT